MSYRDTAEYALRGAAAVTNLMHEETRDIDKASKAVAGAPKTTKKKAKRKIAKKAAPKKNAKRSGVSVKTSALNVKR
jgi:hypothetical protein